MLKDIGNKMIDKNLDGFVKESSKAIGALGTHIFLLCMTIGFGMIVTVFTTTYNLPFLVLGLGFVITGFMSVIISRK